MSQQRLLRRRIYIVLGYTVGTILVFVAGVLIFSISERDTEFAVSVFGSTIGGFLGALLASIVVVEMYTRSSGPEE